MKPRLADERGFVIASLLRLVFILLVLGLVVVEGGSILFTRLTLGDAVEYAATQGAAQLQSSRSPQAAQAATAEALAERETDATLTRFEVLPDGGVRVTATKQAATVLVHRISFLEDLARVEATASGRPVDPNL
jgi:Flp pilus assembly protein TadG